MYISYGSHNKYAHVLKDAIEKLGIECGAGPYPPDKKEFIVRWGSIGPCSCKSSVVINPLIAIKRTSNKKLARYRMGDKLVPIPDFYDDGDDTWPVIGREEYHQEGTGFYVCNNYDDIKKARADGASYFSHVFIKTHEFRVHCGHGKVLTIQDKDDAGFNDEGHFRNRAFWWIPYRADSIKEVMLAGLGATAALGLDFSAVDVMYNEKDGECAVLECNSAPALNSPLVTRRYAAYFRWLLEQYNKEGKKAPHHKFSSKMDKKNMWWYLKEGK